MYEERPRRVVPKWRPSAITASMPEAKSLRAGVNRDLSLELTGKLNEFQLLGSVPVAAELMFLASQAGNAAVAKDAANSILRSTPQITSKQLVNFANRVVGNESTEKTIPPDFIREARKILAVDYRNPILLIDVARELTARNQEKAAERYVRAAVALAPNSRFVIRSAARFFLHTGDHELAHDVLLRSPLHRYDPWIQASEIAVATVRERTSALAKKVIRSFAASDTTGVHQAELLSAVATVELIAGAEKNAKRLFQRALTKPNDNSLAQAEWAATRLNLVVDERALRTPMSYEAISNNAYRRLQIDDAIKHALEWAHDEPFASRPRDSLGYYYCLVGDYARAQIAFLDAIKVDDAFSLNAELNVLYTRIQTGDVDRAYADLIRLAQHPQAKNFAPHLLADVGALAYVTNDHTVGREYYERAIQLAKTRSEPSTEALARAYFARAATESGDVNAATIRNEMAKAVETLPSPGALYVMSSVLKGQQRAALEDIAAKRVATRKWEWDQATNTFRVF